MVSVYDLKPRFQGLLRPLSNRLAALVMSVAAGALVALFPDRRWPLLLIP